MLPHEPDAGVALRNLPRQHSMRTRTSTASGDVARTGPSEGLFLERGAKMPKQKLVDPASTPIGTKVQVEIVPTVKLVVAQVVAECIVESSEIIDGE